MDLTIKLSDHFTLAEMVESEVARVRGYNEQFDPPAEVIEALRALCNNVLEPLRQAISEAKGVDTPLIVTSAYRCARVNGDVPGHASNSQHIRGQAADTHVDCMSIEGWYQFIKHGPVQFDQLIQEHGYWAHVSFNNTHPIQRGDCERATGTIPAPIYNSDGLGDFKNKSA